MIVFLAARGRQIIRRAFAESALGLKISERLRRERDQFAQVQLLRLVFDELDQLLSDAVIFGSQKINRELEGYVKESEKPYLEFQPMDKYIDAFSDFYDEILVDESVTVD